MVISCNNWNPLECRKSHEICEGAEGTPYSSVILAVPQRYLTCRMVIAAEVSNKDFPVDWRHLEKLSKVVHQTIEPRGQCTAH